MQGRRLLKAVPGLEKSAIVILGFSGNAREAFDLIESRFHILAFLDDRTELQSSRFCDIPIQPLSALANYPQAQVLCLIGSEKSYRQRAAFIADLGLPMSRFATLVAPDATVARAASIGPGSVLMPGVRIMGNASLGNHVLVMPNSVIHHDCQIGSCSLIGSNVVIAGSVILGESCYLGSGSTLRNGLNIGPQSLIGLGSNVLHDIAAGDVVAGNPARPLRHH